MDVNNPTLSQHKSHSNLDQLRANYPNFKQTNLAASKNEITRSYEDCSSVNNTDEEKESGSEFELEEAHVVHNNGSIDKSIF